MASGLTVGELLAELDGIPPDTPVAFGGDRPEYGDNWVEPLGGSRQDRVITTGMGPSVLTEREVEQNPGLGRLTVVLYR